MSEENKPPRRLSAIRWQGMTTVIVGGEPQDCPQPGDTVLIDRTPYEVVEGKPIPQYQLEVKEIVR